MRCVAVVIVLLLAAGCSAPVVDRSGPAAPAPAPSVPAAPQPDVTAEQLLTLLPGSADLFPWRVTTRCTSAIPSCVGLDGPGVGARISSADTDSGALSMSVVQFADADASAAAITRSRRSEQRRYDGRFDHAPRRLDAHTTSSGQRGAGTVSDLSLGSWTGWRTEAHSTTYVGDHTLPRNDLVEATLRRDRTVVSVLVVRPVHVSAAGPTFDELVAGLVERADALLAQAGAPSSQSDSVTSTMSSSASPSST